MAATPRRQRATKAPTKALTTDTVPQISAKPVGKPIGGAPVAYFGGKRTLAARIVALFPPHAVYVEPYAGSAAVFFCKTPARVETLNDADGALVNFFRVLRDPATCARLREALSLTPYAREEWADARLGLKAAARGWDDAADDVELARRWFVFTQQGFSGRTAVEGSGWRFVLSAGHNPAQTYRNAIDALPAFTARLAQTQIEHDDALAIITRYDSKQTLFYIDPPYLPETRRGGGYGHEMSADDHARLLDLITARGFKSMVVLSGYDSTLYRERLEQAAGWERLEITTTAAAAGRTRGSALRGEGAVYAAGQTRTEVLWLNPAAQAAQGLWTALTSETATAPDPQPTQPQQQPPPKRKRTTKGTARRTRA